MEISASRNKVAEYQLEIGPVMFSLPSDAVKALQQVIDQRLNQNSAVDDENTKRKMTAYRVLASKMTGVDDRIVQKFAPQVTPEQLVTIVRMAEGDSLFKKVAKNLSKQNRRQFEEDYAAMDKITEQHACLYMEQIVPLIKRAAQEQKELYSN
ncbi:MAG: FliG C-terminal domain-containing protein [Pseudomonadota bacterium]|nr:FliG C-terminal domain-containing protein [Pseudomonadota bacterium]